MVSDDTGELAAALPGYEIGGELGRGAFGTVLAGRHRRLGRQVAIKRLPRFFSDHPEVRHRFSAEAKVLASLDHPHIVPIYDYVEEGGLCVLVMELLPGGSVRQWQAAGLTAQAACAIALAACSALDYAHQRGVLHRDVKPDNLLFTSAGLLKVTDFGIAKVVGDVAVTQIGETPGTPMYMAPEQCLDQPLSPATDVYSTGVMLYELLARQHPLAGSGDVVSTMYRQVHEQAPPLHVVNRDLPESLSQVVMRALVKDPSGRYRSARAFGGALADAAAAVWGSSWPAGDALRIMSVGPIEAATGWPLTTGPVAEAAPPEDPVAAARTRLDGTSPPPGVFAPPLHPTVLRAPSPAPWTPAAPPAPAPWAPAAPATPAATQGLPYPQSAATSPDFQGAGHTPASSSPGFPPPAGPTSYAPPVPVAPVPAPSGGGRRRGPLVALAGAVLAIVVVAALVALNRGGAASSPDAPTTVASQVDRAGVAAQLNQLIQQSATARIQVVSTVATIEDCSASPQGAGTALGAAVTTRQQVVTQLARLAVDALPNGVAMRSAMTNALNDSVDADRHFQSWLAGITAVGGCQGQAPHDANWQAAQASSNAATGAKNTFATLWNPVATTYGLPKVSSATI